MSGVSMHDHIKYLLFRHNCLVLPGFGGIVLQYSPARIHPAQHIFQPPRKALAFNRSLTTNDGLLITHVANSENLHYDEAETKVKKFVEEIENAIRRKGDFKLTGIGRFHNDIEGNLQFEPDEQENYLLNAYGLDKFVSPAVVRRDTFEPQVGGELKKKKRRFGWFGIVAIGLVVLLVTVQILSIQDLSSLIRNPLAGIIMLSPSGNTEDTIKAISESISHQPVGKRDTVVILIKDETAELPAVKDSSAPVVEKPIETNSNIITSVESSATPFIPIKVDTRKPEEKIADSLRLLTISKVPMRGEYNPGELGKYVIVFSNSFDSTKAVYFQKQLWKDRIGAQVLRFHKRLIVAKPGYLTARAAAKDLYFYRLLGYDDAYIIKMKGEQR